MLKLLLCTQFCKLVAEVGFVEVVSVEFLPSRMQYLLGILFFFHLVVVAFTLVLHEGIYETVLGSNSLNSLLPCECGACAHKLLLTASGNWQPYNCNGIGPGGCGGDGGGGTRCWLCFWLLFCQMTARRVETI